MPIRNHVERRFSARRRSEPVIVDSPSEPIAVTLWTRPDGPVIMDMSVKLPGARRTRFSRDAETTNGPQRWYGEIVSYGSLTDTRYGNAGELGHAAAAAAARPA